MPFTFHGCPPEFTYICLTYFIDALLYHSYFTHAILFSTICIFTHTLLQHSHISQAHFYGCHRHPPTECIFRDTLLLNVYSETPFCRIHISQILYSVQNSCFFFTGTLPQNSRVTDDFFHTDHFIYFHWHSSPDLRFTGALLHGSYFTDAFLHISQMQITQIMFTDALLQRSHFPDALLQSSQTPSTEF